MNVAGHIQAAVGSDLFFLMQLEDKNKKSPNNCHLVHSFREVLLVVYDTFKSASKSFQPAPSQRTDSEHGEGRKNVFSSAFLLCFFFVVFFSFLREKASFSAVIQ